MSRLYIFGQLFSLSINIFFLFNNQNLRREIEHQRSFTTFEERRKRTKT